METQNEKQPTPTPKYGSFTGMTKSPYKYPYEWAPFFMMLLMTAVAGGVWYLLNTFFGINQWVSLILGVVAGIAVGFLYNAHAHSMGWQKLHWIDILLSSDIFWP